MAQLTFPSNFPQSYRSPTPLALTPIEMASETPEFSREQSTSPDTNTAEQNSCAETYQLAPPLLAPRAPRKKRVDNCHDCLWPPGGCGCGRMPPSPPQLSALGCKAEGRLGTPRDHSRHDSCHLSSSGAPNMHLNSSPPPPGPRHVCRAASRHGGGSQARHYRATRRDPGEGQPDQTQRTALLHAYTGGDDSNKSCTTDKLIILNHNK